MRYVIGIDLGTTNCALAFVDTEQPSLPLQLFTIPQLAAAGKIDTLSTLPSFCYLAGQGEWPAGSLKLPWKEETTTFVGQLAKVQGARVPTRLIQSAKSWLCNVAANRRDKILPIEAADITQRLSPVEASTKYLAHLRDAWNASMAKGNPALEFEEQEIILTVPASFDEVARTLTVEAARQAGFLHITLLEEPQAAFYSWIAQHEKEWQSQFKAGECILVCDVGGGTTDFSLIEIQEKDDKLSFQRMAVGDHLLLGGDNMDAALAHFLEQKLQQQGTSSLESTQWLQLQAEARTAKEVLMRQDVKFDQTHTIVLQGSGSSVIKGSLSVTISREEVERILVEGFFGLYSLQEALQLKRSRGFRTMGLPYEDEPSITKHLAHFLQQAQVFKKGQGIDYILFNGGAIKPEIFQQSLEKALTAWFPQTHLKRLSTVSLDLAVARGAAYYGKVRRGFGVAIGGGLPRTYYLKVDVKDSAGQITSKALTLLPRGTPEGHVYQPDQIFALRSNTPVAFHLLTSHVRLDDNQGDLVEIDQIEMQPLPAIQTILRFGRKQIRGEGESILPVRLGIRLTEIGTVELWLESQTSEHKWSLEFQLRSATGQEVNAGASEPSASDETFAKGYLEEAEKAIEALFQEAIHKPSQIMERLEGLIGTSRRDWGPSLLRALWNPLLRSYQGRQLSAEHGARWWNLAGFFLRPGFGFPLDDFRIKELWKIILAELKTPSSSECQIQQWICFRRIAGGLNKGQQMQIASELLSTVVDKKTGKIELKRKGDHYVYSEKIRALASFERMDLPLKIRLGEALVDRILRQSPESYDFWSLGRIGARHLIYGSAGQVVPKEKCVQWVEKLLQKPPTSLDQESMQFLLGQLARKTDHRELNLPDELIQKIMTAYPDANLKHWLLESRVLTSQEQEQVFGDRLPAGLMLELSSTGEG